MKSKTENIISVMTSSWVLHCKLKYKKVSEMEHWQHTSRVILFAFCLVMWEKKKTFCCVRWGDWERFVGCVCFFFPGSDSSSDVLVRFKRRCSVSSRRPRTVFGGAPSSPSQAGSTILLTWCSARHKSGSRSAKICWVGNIHTVILMFG